MKQKTSILILLPNASLPSRERGLKRSTRPQTGKQAAVAPLAGAWIETGRTRQRPCRYLVAPLAGAWIETESWAVMRTFTMSLPSRERGLKLCEISSERHFIMSLPSRERGLKQGKTSDQTCSELSLPSRERGLKQVQVRKLLRGSEVAPLAGAWIETTACLLTSCRTNRRSPRGSVD